MYADSHDYVIVLSYISTQYIYTVTYWSNKSNANFWEKNPDTKHLYFLNLLILFRVEKSLAVVKGALQSDLRMCTKEPTFYDTNSLTMFWVLAKPDCCFLIIYYTLEAWKYK